MRLFVLAGGYGSRLSKVLKGTAKALAPVGNTPFLKIQLESWIDQGITEFTFLLHHHADQIVSFLESEKFNILKKCDVICVIENTPMGTGGAISNAIRELRFQGDFLIVNADTWLGCGVLALSDSASPSIAVVQVSDVGRYGQVEFNQSFQVTRFLEKNHASTAGWINAGMSHFDSSLFNKWDGIPFSLERSLLVDLSKDKQLSVVTLQTEFIDIGVPSDYTRFCRWIFQNRNLPL